MNHFNDGMYGAILLVASNIVMGFLGYMQGYRNAERSFWRGRK